MERDIMTIDKNNEGAWRICENINGYLETQVYYFYTKKDAIKKFREYKKNLINQQKGTMKKIILFTLGFLFCVAVTVSLAMYSLHQIVIYGNISL